MNALASQVDQSRLNTVTQTESQHQSEQPLLKIMIPKQIQMQSNQIHAAVNVYTAGWQHVVFVNVNVNIATAGAVILAAFHAALPSSSIGQQS